MAAHGSEKRERAKSLTLRLSPAERATIEQAASRVGKMLGAYVRELVLGAPVPRQSRRPVIERAELARLLGQVGRLNDNLKAIVGAAREHPPETVVQAASDIAALRGAVMRALSRGD